MEEMITASDLRILHFLVAYGTDIIKTVELVSTGFGEGIDLVDCRAALHEHAPSSPCLTPDVEICMYTHHDCSLAVALTVMAAITVFIVLTFAQYETKTIPTEIRYRYTMTRCLVHSKNTNKAVIIPKHERRYFKDVTIRTL